MEANFTVAKHDTLLVTNEEYLPVLMKLLDHARKSVDIVAYSFAIGSASGKISFNGAPFQIAQKLVEIKKKRRLKIRLYIEGRRETFDRNRPTAEYLKKHGVTVKYGSTHAKGFCIDGKYLLFGSTNLTQQSILKNNETNLLLEDPAAIQGFEKYFTHLWKGGKHGGIKLPPPMIADGGFKDALIALIDSAKKTLDFSIYFFHHTEIEKALIRASERGVKVSGFIHNHFAFAMSYVRRTRGTAERLREAGIAEIHYGPVHLFTHSKFIVADRKEILLGTGNWLHEDVKIHPQLYIHLQNPRLAQELVKYLAAQIRGAKKKR